MAEVNNIKHKKRTSSKSRRMIKPKKMKRIKNNIEELNQYRSRIGLYSESKKTDFISKCSDCSFNIKEDKLRCIECLRIFQLNV